MSFRGMEEYGCEARLWGLVAEQRHSRLKPATKNLVLAARTSLPNGLKVAGATG